MIHTLLAWERMRKKEKGKHVTSFLNCVIFLIHNVEIQIYSRHGESILIVEAINSSLAIQPQLFRNLLVDCLTFLGLEE